MPCSENISKKRGGRREIDSDFIDVHEAMNRSHLKGATRILCNSKQMKINEFFVVALGRGILNTVDRTWLASDVNIA